MKSERTCVSEAVQVVLVSAIALSRHDPGKRWLFLSPA
jgi:hypothetical protein